MAKLIEDVLVIKVSKLIRDTDETSGVLSEEAMTALEQVTQELAGEGVLVEVTRA